MMYLLFLLDKSQGMSIENINQETLDFNAAVWKILGDYKSMIVVKKLIS